MTYALKHPTSRRILEFLLQVHRQGPQKSMNIFDLVPLTYELDLDIHPLDLHAKIQVRMSFRLLRRTRQMHRPSNGVKTITPNMSQMWGVIGTFFILRLNDILGVSGRIAPSCPRPRTWALLGGWPQAAPRPAVGAIRREGSWHMHGWVVAKGQGCKVYEC